MIPTSAERRPLIAGDQAIRNYIVAEGKLATQMAAAMVTELEQVLRDETSRPQRLGSQEGEQDGNKLGVHPDRTRQDAEGPRGRGVHGGSGVLDRAGSDPETGRAESTGRRGLAATSPGEAIGSPGEAIRRRVLSSPALFWLPTLLVLAVLAVLTVLAAFSAGVVWVVAGVLR